MSILQLFYSILNDTTFLEPILFVHLFDDVFCSVCYSLHIKNQLMTRISVCNVMNNHIHFIQKWMGLVQFQIITHACKWFWIWLEFSISMCVFETFKKYTFRWWILFIRILWKSSVMRRRNSVIYLWSVKWTTFEPIRRSNCAFTRGKLKL